MQCPYCGQDRDKVVDSRSSEGGRTVRRRRQCLACSRRFTTYERPEEGVRLKVVKKGGQIETYERGKVIAGLQNACYKRPVGDEHIRRIVESLEEEMLQQFDREVPSSFIGERLGEHLRALDKIAYVRFASVYREFADVGELIEDAQKAHSEPQPHPKQKDLFASQDAPPDQDQAPPDQ